MRATPTRLELLSPRTSVVLISGYVLLFAIQESSAQISFQPFALAERLGYYLPWKGPGAAMFNPASLTEIGTVQLDLATSARIGGFADNPFLQASIRLPLGLAAGMAGQWKTNKVDNSNAVYIENIYVPMLAAGWPFDPEAPIRGAIGLSLPINYFNTFGVANSTNTSMNIGALLISRLPRPFGQARLGLTMTGAVQAEVKLPDRRGSYNPSREFNAALTWTLVDGMFEVHSEWFKILKDPPGPEGYPDNLTIKTFGLEFNPTGSIGLKFERTATGSRTLGTIVRLELMPVWKQELEFDISHDRLNVYDEGRGFMWGLALSTGF